jgi:hypothetical protein
MVKPEVERKIGIKFKLPFFEFYGEWVFQTSEMELRIPG